MHGCSVLKRYYAQLYTLYNKFKIMKGHLDLKFTWTDTYSRNPVEGDIQFELDCIMYNIGALHALLAAMDKREGSNLKVACTHFQCAVWAFEVLKDRPQNSKSKDMSHDIISFLYHTMLAQAQECFLEKSISDNLKSIIIARVAAQVIEYYDNALIVLIQASLSADANVITDIVGTRLYKEWQRFIEFKISFYSAVCALYMGNHCEEEQKSGERIAWYLSGKDHLKQVEKLCKTTNREEITSAFTYLEKLLNKKCSDAQRENDLVYHEVVPTSDKLTAVKGASLVAGVKFDVSDPEICGKDIFARLVPIEAHEMASIYSENKDHIMRNIRIKIDEKDAELAEYMSSLQLDKITLRADHQSVPDELVELCAELSVKPKICEDIKDSLEKLNDIANDVSKKIADSNLLLKGEEEKEKLHQDCFGKRGPSLVVIDLRKELKKHEETHRRGLASNKNLQQVLDKFTKDIKLLINCSAKDLERLLPPYTDIPFDEDNINEIERLLDKVQEMKNQRALLERQLRESIQQDDVMKHVLAHSKDEVESIFKKKLQKYDGKVALIDQNLAAQENILAALTKASALYGKARMAVSEVTRLRSNRIQTFLLAYDGISQVKTNVEKGIEFYNELKNMVDKLYSRIKSVVKVQDEERQQIVQAQLKNNLNRSNNIQSHRMARNTTPSFNSPIAPQQYVPPTPTTQSAYCPSQVTPNMSNLSLASNSPSFTVPKVPSYPQWNVPTASTMPSQNPETYQSYGVHNQSQSHFQQPNQSQFPQPSHTQFPQLPQSRYSQPTPLQYQPPPLQFSQPPQTQYQPPNSQPPQSQYQPPNSNYQPRSLYPHYQTQPPTSQYGTPYLQSEQTLPYPTQTTFEDKQAQINQNQSYMYYQQPQIPINSPSNQVDRLSLGMSMTTGLPDQYATQMQEQNHPYSSPTPQDSNPPMIPASINTESSSEITSSYQVQETPTAQPDKSKEETDILNEFDPLFKNVQ